MFEFFFEKLVSFIRSIWTWPDGQSRQIKVFDEPHTVVMPVNPVEADIMARTIWGEARNEGTAGMTAVANVIMNRIKLAKTSAGYRSLFGSPDAISVCQKPRQFSCWNLDDPNRALLIAVTPANPQFQTAYSIALKALSGQLADTTGGSTHYLTKAAYNQHQQRPKGPSSWSSGEEPFAVAGSHYFFQYSQTV